MSQIQVPKGWESKNILELTDIEYGKTLPTKEFKDKGYPVFGANGVIGYYDKFNHQTEQVLISCRGANSGKVNISPEKCFITNNSLIVKTKNDKILNKKFLFYALQNIPRKKIVTGSAQPQVTIDNLSPTLLSFPNIEIQKKIVKKLDHILEQLEGKQKEILEFFSLNKINNLKKNLENEILRIAFCGRLSERDPSDEPIGKLLNRIKIKNNLISENISQEIKQSHKIPTEWKWVKIDQICRGTVPGRYKPSNFDGDIPWITMPDLDGFYVEKSKKALAITKEEAKNVNMKVFPQNTVLMSCVGDVGKIAITKTAIVPNQQFHGFLPYDKIIPEYIAFALLSEADQIKKTSTQTTVAYLNKTNCNSLYIPVAPLEEQERIVSKINEKFKNIQLIDEHVLKAKQNHEHAKKYLENLTSQVLATAFSGKLVN